MSTPPSPAHNMPPPLTDLIVPCLFIDSERKITHGDAFSVRVQPNATIEGLKEAVKLMRPRILEDVDLAMLTVWRCMDPKLFVNVEMEEMEEALSKVDFTNKKKANRPGIGQRITALGLSDMEILLVQLPASEVEKDIEETRDTPSELLATTHRKANLSVFTETMSADKPDSVKKAHLLLLTGRVDGRYGHPVALYHQDLALLQRRFQMLDVQAKTGQDWADPNDLEGRTEFDADLLYVARTAFGSFRDFYRSEDDHWKAIKSQLEWIFGKEVMKEQKRSDYKEGPGGKSSAMDGKHGSKGRGSSSKGVNRADAVAGNHAVMEDKNLVGVAGDASLQGMIWYGKHCNSSKDVFKCSKLPIILIGTTGNVLEVSIAVCLEEVVVDKILHFEILESDHRDETVIKLALIFSALKTCGARLFTEYEEFTKTAGRDGEKQQTWHMPCPSAVAPTPNSVIPALKFKAKLSQSNQTVTAMKEDYSDMRPLYVATYQGSDVVVKFAVTYNRTAHDLAAEEKYAPKLFAQEDVIGGLIMVVMEKVDGVRMCDKDYRSLPCSVFEDLEKALKIIHDRGLVFGDLRDTNVMITASNEVKLVDFDWTNEEGKGRYPALINQRLVGKEWHPNVRELGLMYKVHDEYALSKLISKYCDNAEYRETKCKEVHK